MTENIPNINEISILSLAFLGDALYDGYVRETLLKAYPLESAGRLHKRASNIVCAAAQAQTAQAIMERLTGDERAVFMRGRNGNPATLPKNARPIDYKLATGLEAVLGYLQMTGQYERLNEVLTSCKQSGWGNADE